MSLNVQFLTMIVMILGGFYLGIALETFRRFSSFWKNNVFLTYLFEITFWLSQTFILFYLLYRVNAGELRIYIFIACLLGFAIYHALAVNLYKRMLEQMIRVVSRLFSLLKNLLLILVINPLKWVIYILITLMQFIFTILYSLLKVIILPVKWMLRGINNLLPERIQKIITKWGGFYSIIKSKCIMWMKNMTFKGR